jgi:hypothetical protein
MLYTSPSLSLRLSLTRLYFFTPCPILFIALNTACTTLHEIFQRSLLGFPFLLTFDRDSFHLGFGITLNPIPSFHVFLFPWSCFPTWKNRKAGTKVQHFFLFPNILKKIFYQKTANN